MKTNTTLSQNDNGTVTFAGEIAWEIWSAHKPQALKRIGESVSIDGFRKGHIPETALVQKVGLMAVLEEMAQLALMEEYPKAIVEHTIDAIGRPSIEITKIAEGSALGFKITTSVMPSVKLADYKKLAKTVYSKHEKIEVTDEDVEAAVKEFAKLRHHHTLTEEAKKSGTDVPHLADLKDTDVPALTDEDVKSYGNFTDLADFREKLAHNLLHEKENRYAEKKQNELLDELYKETTVTLPDVLIEYEIDRMVHQLDYDLTQAGMDMKTYLEHIKKTTEDLRTDMRESAKKHATLELIMDTLAREEKITAPADILEQEMDRVKTLYGESKEFDENRARTYLTTTLTNQAVLQFLESLGEPIPSHPHHD